MAEGAGGDEILSMVDVLEEGKQMEEEAAAVLGDSDDKCCTYPLGYVNRQALYACMTCKEQDTNLAGICLACSYECHEGHEFVELYTKRNFRCDCGNSKFPNMSCKLIKNKRAENADNKYNHNFTGVYCVCERPYPDPEDGIDDEMIQCVVCEDWFHGRHLGTSRVPENEDYQEMVCGACMHRCDFLWYYTIHSLETKMVKEESNAEVDIMTGEQGQVKTESSTPSAVVVTKDESPSTSTISQASAVPETSQASPADPETSQPPTTTSQTPPVNPATSDATISSSSSTDVARNTAISETLPTPSAASAAVTSLDGVSSSTSVSTTDKEMPSEETIGNNKQEGKVTATAAILATSTDAVSSNVATTDKPTTQVDVTTCKSETEAEVPTTSSFGTTPRSDGEQAPTEATSSCDSLKRKREDTEASSSDAGSVVKPEEQKESAAAGSSQSHRTMSDSTVEASSAEEGQKVEGDDKIGCKKEEEENKVDCRLKELRTREVQKKEGAVFWPLRWRTKLCSCQECQAMYETLEVSYLQDPADTVVAYEERGKGKSRSLYGEGMEALSSMNRVQQVEMLHGYQDMKSALSEFLKSFADQGKVVTATDIQEFYDSLNRKRQRVGSASAVQYLCR